jgi:ribosomal protein S18 acetylase RimI-like enzyme
VASDLAPMRPAPVTVEWPAMVPITGCQWRSFDHTENRQEVRLWSKDWKWIGEVALVHQGASIYLRRVRVMPAYRRQGFGTKMLCSVLETFRDLPVWLYVEPERDGLFGYEELRAWYTRHGFTPQDTNAPYLMRRVVKEGGSL